MQQDKMIERLDTMEKRLKEIDDLFRIIRKLRNEGRGIVYISHRLEEKMQIRSCLPFLIWKYVIFF